MLSLRIHRLYVTNASTPPEINVLLCVYAEVWRLPGAHYSIISLYIFSFCVWFILIFIIIFVRRKLCMICGACLFFLPPFIPNILINSHLGAVIIILFLFDTIISVQRTYAVRFPSLFPEHFCVRFWIQVFVLSSIIVLQFECLINSQHTAINNQFMFYIKSNVMIDVGRLFASNIQTIICKYRLDFICLKLNAS